MTWKIADWSKDDSFRNQKLPSFKGVRSSTFFQESIFFIQLNLPQLRLDICPEMYEYCTLKCYTSTHFYLRQCHPLPPFSLEFHKTNDMVGVFLNPKLFIEAQNPSDCPAYPSRSSEGATGMMCWCWHVGGRVKSGTRSHLPVTMCLGGKVLVTDPGAGGGWLWPWPQQDLRRPGAAGPWPSLFSRAWPSPTPWRKQELPAAGISCHSLHSSYLSDSKFQK